MEPAEISFDTKSTLKYNLRGLVFNQDPILRSNLLTGTQILHSEEYPTQVFRLKGVKYVRINTHDIANLETDENITDMLKTLLAIDDYSIREGDVDKDIKDIIADAVDYYQTWTGEDLRESEVIDADEYGNITNVDRLALKQKVFKPVAGEESSNEETLGKDDDMTKDARDMAEASGMTESSDSSSDKCETAAYEFDLKEVEQSLEEVKHFKDKSKFSSRSSIITAKEILELNSLVKDLLKAFKGSKSKQKRITPRKLISAKSMAMDAEKIYVDHMAPVGKHIEFNLLIDMSGSMGGAPIKNAVSLIYIFNKLAQQGYVTGNVLYSTTKYHYVRQFPMQDAEVLSLCQTQSSEGLAETVDANVEVLKNVNCICITDGDIVDRPIDKTFWRKHKIVSTGVYINPHMDNPLEYSGKLDKWFDHSLVRATMKDMVQLLVKLGIKG